MTKAKRPLLYFKNAEEWREWLHENHHLESGVDLVFYKVASEQPSMRWEEAVQVAICYGWIDSNTSASEMQKAFGAQLTKLTLNV